MKNLLFSVAFVCLAAPAFAQFSLGLSAGPNLSTWKWHIKSLDYDLNYESAMGYRATVLGEWQISPRCALRAEFGGDVKSNKLSGLVFEDGTVAPTYKEHYQYWNGSVLVQLSPLKNLRPLYLLAGCTAGRLTKGWHTGASNGPINIQTANFNRNAVAADFGLGGNIPLGATSALKVEARYQYGLTNFSGSDNVDARVSSVVFNVGYLHRL